MTLGTGRGTGEAAPGGFVEVEDYAAAVVEVFAADIRLAADWMA